MSQWALVFSMNSELVTLYRSGDAVSGHKAINKVKIKICVGGVIFYHEFFN